MKRQKRLIYALITVVCFVAAGFLGGCDTSQIGLEQRNCVVMLGDSIFDLSNEITNVLQDLSGQRYRTYYLNGAQMAGGFITDIEAQYDQAARAGAIRTIIMDGGGNDFLMGNRNNPEAIAREIREAYGRILDKAQNDSVENIVVLGYYTTSTTPDGGALDNGSTGADLEAAAASRGIKLVYVDPMEDSWFSSRRPAQYTIADGIHPTAAASAELARLIWDAMVANDIEQGEGCPGGAPGGCN